MPQLYKTTRGGGGGGGREEVYRIGQKSIPSARVAFRSKFREEMRSMSRT